MIGRETLELDAVVPQEERTVGVIGVGPGVGVTMICRLLEKEQAGKGEKARILDMGKVSPGEILTKKMDRLLVVADGREEFPEGLELLLGRFNESGSRVGVVLNRWSPSSSPTATPLPRGERQEWTEESPSPSPAATPLPRGERQEWTEESPSPSPAATPPPSGGRQENVEKAESLGRNEESPSPSPTATPLPGGERQERSWLAPGGELSAKRTERGLPIFRVPELLPEELKGLYNFVFYN